MIKIPEVKEDIDFSNVIKLATKRRNSILDGDYHEDNDDNQYIFEEVMMAIFGKEYFNWENINV